MAVHVALLRGINVGGKNKVPMKGLAAMFVEAGCQDVQTYIQSGNVVFAAPDALADRVADRISESLSARLGLQIPVITRTAAELRDVVQRNPFLASGDAGADTEGLHVAFLADAPSAAQVESLDPNRSPPDQFTVRGREIFLRCPNGLARTKLTNDYFDRKLRTTSTVRNWRTVLTLLKMAEAAE